jgi:transporter family-2 protein
MKVLYYLVAFIAGSSLSIEGAIGGTLGENIGKKNRNYILYVFDGVYDCNTHYLILW